MAECASLFGKLAEDVQAQVRRMCRPSLQPSPSQPVHIVPLLPSQIQQRCTDTTRGLRSRSFSDPESRWEHAAADEPGRRAAVDTGAWVRTHVSHACAVALITSPAHLPRIHTCVRTHTSTAGQTRRGVGAGWTPGRGTGGVRAPGATAAGPRASGRGCHSQHGRSRSPRLGWSHK